MSKKFLVSLASLLVAIHSIVAESSPESLQSDPGQAVNSEADPLSAETPSAEPVPARLIPIEGYLQPESIAIPPQIPGYRLFQIDRNVMVSGVLEGGGEFDAVLPLYVYYPNSKTINLTKELEQAQSLMKTIQGEMVKLRQESGSQGSRRLNDSLSSLDSIIETLATMQREEISSFNR